MEKPRRYQGAKDKETTCSVCLDVFKEFKEPKKLPCGHIYCKSCLEGLIQHSSGAQLTCPTCRSKTEVPNKDVSNLPTAVLEIKTINIHGAVVDPKEKLLVGQESHVIIDLRVPGKEFQIETSKIESELVSVLRRDLGIRGRVESISLNQIKVTFTPRIRGKHKLIIKVDGAHIMNSPFVLMVTIPPTCLTEPVCTLLTGLEQPTSVIYSKGKVITAETMGEKVTEIDVQNLGHRLKNSVSLVLQVTDCQVLLHGLNGASALVCDFEDNLHVSVAHQVQKFSRNGRHIKTVGCYGTGQAEFMNPSGLGVTCKGDGELYVCDSNNHRIQVLDLDLKFKRSFGSQGKAAGQFCYPTSIAFDSNGQIFIADSMNNRIQCFSSKECPLYAIEHKNLSTPTGLLLHDDHLYVTDYHNHRVMVITLAGDFVTTFGSEHVKFPEGITVDEDGFLYVTSDHSNIVVF